MNQSQVYAKHLGARISPKKLAPVADLVRGKNILDAKIALTFDPTKAAKMILKVLNSAEANALHNNKMNNSLYVSEIWVGAGPMLKRGRLVAKSRFSPILKRTANIYVGLSELHFDNFGAPKKIIKETVKVEKAATPKRAVKKAETKKVEKVEKVKRTRAPKKS
jgi:large subunit ribosomal protein L22